MTDSTKSAERLPEADVFLDEIFAEISDRLRHHRSVDIEQYVDRYPQYAEKLRTTVEAMQALVELGHVDPNASEIGQPDHLSPASHNGVLGDYRLIREIGRGGMGVVYEAEQISLQRRVALKVLPFAAILDQRRLQRFRNEAIAAAGLDHPHIVQVHYVGCERAVHFYAMQYIEGQDVGELIRQLQMLIHRSTERSSPPPDRETIIAERLLSGQLDVAASSDHNVKHETGDTGTTVMPRSSHEGLASRSSLGRQSASTGIGSRAYCRCIAAFGVQAANALEYAHQRGVLHRDIKPANLMLDAQNNIFITDFGLARIHDDDMLTRSGDIIGTLRYMPPEQATGARGLVDHRCDLYSLGATLYELLTLKPLFPDADRPRLFQKITTEDPVRPSLHNAAVPGDLETILCKSLQKNPADRYSSCAAFAEDLTRFLNGRPIRAKRVRLSERMFKWVLRHRTAAVAVAGIMFAVMLAMIVMTVQSMTFSQRQSELLQQAERLKQEAQTNSERATANMHRLGRTLYYSRIEEAGKAHAAGKLRELSAILDRTTPGPDDTDYRDGAWFWLHNHARLPHKVIHEFESPKYTMCFTPDGSSYAIAGKDGVIGFYEAQSHRLLTEVDSGQIEVNGLAFAPDGNALASAGDDGTARIWEIDWQQMHVQERLVIPACDGLVFNVLFANEGRTLITGGQEPTVHLWDATNGGSAGTLDKHSDTADVLALSPDGTQLITSGMDSLVQAWDLQTLKPLAHRQGHVGEVKSLQFSPDGGLLATGSSNGHVLVRKSRSLGAYWQHRLPAAVHSVCFHPAGNHVIAGDDRGALTFLPVRHPGQQSLPPYQVLSPLVSKVHDGRIYWTGLAPGGATNDDTVECQNVTISGMTTPVALNTNAGIDAKDDHFAQIATDGDGTWLATWQSEDSLGGTLGQDSDILVARSTNAGQTWSAPSALNSTASSDHVSDRKPQIIAAGNGTWLATWYSFNSLDDTIGSDLDILVSRSTDDGVTWSAPSALNSTASTDSGSDSDPEITTDGNGICLAVWEANDSLGGTDFDILYSRSVDGGLTWSDARALNTTAFSDVGDDCNPQITTDGSGTRLATWISTEDMESALGTDQDILFARSTDDGMTWSAPKAVNQNAHSDSGQDRQPQITTDGSGNWLAAWESNDTLGMSIGDDWDILYSRSIDGGVTWSAAAPLNSKATSDVGDDRVPQITTDGNGSWVATWHSNDTLSGTVGADFDILMAHSTDNGVTWSDPVPLNRTAFSDSRSDYRPQMTTDGSGTWRAIWQSTVPLNGIGRDMDILVSRYIPENSGSGEIGGSHQAFLSKGRPPDDTVGVDLLDPRRKASTKPTRKAAEGSGAAGSIRINPVAFGPLVAGHSAELKVDVGNTHNGAQLDAWIDFNRDGVWDPTERIATSINVVTGDNHITFEVPAAAAGSTSARICVSHSGNETADREIYSLGRDGKLIATPVNPPVPEYILQTNGPSSYPKFLTIADRELLVTLNENQVNTWDLTDGSHVECLLTFEEPLTCLRVSPDSALVAVAGPGCGLVIFDIAKRGVTFSRDLPDQFQPADIVFSPDGLHLAVKGGRVADAGDFIYAMSVESGERHAHIVAGEYRRRIVFSANSRELYASGAVGGTAEIWNLTGQGDSSVVDTFDSGIHHFCLVPDRNAVVTSHLYGAIRVWKLPDWEQTVELQSGADEVRFSALSPRSSLLLSCLKDNRILVSTMQPGIEQPLFSIDCGQKQVPIEAVFSSDARYLVAWIRDNITKTDYTRVMKWHMLLDDASPQRSQMLSISQQ